MNAIATKTCRDCLEDLPLTAFYPNRRQCKSCYQNERIGSHVDRVDERRWYFIKRKYGITQDQYESLLAQQGGVCAICKTDDPGKTRGEFRHFRVDHNHDTGQVRGLLCHSCNLAIGYLKESSDHARALGEYLDHWWRAES